MVTGTREKTQEGQGLTASEVERSRETHGSNRLTRRRGKGFFRQLLERFGDPVIRILLFALGVNLVLSLRGGDPTETVGITVAVLLATLISTLSEYSSARAFSRLCASSLHDTCRVRREGEICEIPISEVVVGDTVLLLSGDGVPADGRLLRGELSVDQSAMTGESREIKKRAAGEYTRSPECPSALLRASTVTAGEGGKGDSLVFNLIYCISRGCSPGV